MSNAKLECIWPARGGGLLNGNFASDLGSWTAGYGTGTADAVTSQYKAGSKSARLITSSGGNIADRYQSVSNYSNYAGKRISLVGWCKSDYPGAYLYIKSASITKSSGQHTGSGSWEPLQVTFDMPASPTSLKCGMINAVPVASEPVYFDAMSLILGDSYGTVTLTESYIYPIGLPEDVRAGTGRCADGEVYGIENNINIITRAYQYEGMLLETYLKLRNFQRYIVCGTAYEFEWTDEDGDVFTARMLSSFPAAAEIGPGLVDATMILELKDIGK